MPHSPSLSRRIPLALFLSLLGTLIATSCLAGSVGSARGEAPGETCEGPGCSELEDAAGSHEILLEDVGFRLQLPAEWKLLEPGNGPFVAVAELPPKQVLAMLTRTPIGADDSKTQGLDNLLAELPKVFVEHEVISTERRLLTSDIYGDVVEVRGQARGLALRHTTYLIEGFGERFALTFATVDPVHLEHAGRFEKIAASLALTGPDPQAALFLELIKLELIKLESSKTESSEKGPSNLAELDRLLDAGVDIGATDSDGFTALATAILSGNGLLTKWLLERGADPAKSSKLAKLLPIIARPPIYELLVQAGFAKPSGPGTVDPTKASAIEWVSADFQLFEGIKNGRLGDVEEALGAGADLAALEPNYRLSALPLTRKLIEEFEELDLDPSRFLPIEKLLLRAAESAPPGARSSDQRGRVPANAPLRGKEKP